MVIKELVEVRADYYSKNSTKNKKLMALIGDIVVKVNVVDSGECFSVVVNKNGYEFIDCEAKSPTVTIEGKEAVLSHLIKTLSSEKYREAEAKGDIKVIPHGIKGRLVVSKVKKMFGMD
ncbi:MAG: hypothetical protein ACTSQY_08610 [Candidatus Odinarchaeia archaeon]